MRIGIDIDDTMTDSTKVVREYINKYDECYCDDKHLINNLESIIRGFLVDETTKNFFQDHSLEMAYDIKIKDNVKYIIDKLRDEGNEIYIITARSDKFYRNAQELCKDYLKKHDINYDKLITSQTFKVETCKNENIDLMIDDAIDTVENVNKEGIKSILFTSEINKDKETHVKRVSNWLELYDVIHNL